MYTPIGADLGVEEIGVYIACRQNMVAQYIATRPIMVLCLTAERNTGLRLSMQWWEQPNMDILGIKAGDAEEEGGEETRMEESEVEGE